MNMAVKYTHTDPRKTACRKYTPSDHIENVGCNQIMQMRTKRFVDDNIGVLKLKITENYVKSVNVFVEDCLRRILPFFMSRT